MACLVLGHLVYCIVDCVQVQLLGALCNAVLVAVGLTLGVHALLDVCLCVPNDVTQKLGELGCVPKSCLSR